MKAACAELAMPSQGGCWSAGATGRFQTRGPHGGITSGSPGLRSEPGPWAAVVGVGVVLRGNVVAVLYVGHRRMGIAGCPMDIENLAACSGSIEDGSLRFRWTDRSRPTIGLVRRWQRHKRHDRRSGRLHQFEQESQDRRMGKRFLGEGCSRRLDNAGMLRTAQPGGRSDIEMPALQRQESSGGWLGRMGDVVPPFPSSIGHAGTGWNQVFGRARRRLA